MMVSEPACLAATMMVSEPACLAATMMVSEPACLAAIATTIVACQVSPCCSREQHAPPWHGGPVDKLRQERRRRGG